MPTNITPTYNNTTGLILREYKKFIAVDLPLRHSPHSNSTICS